MEPVNDSDQTDGPQCRWDVIERNLARIELLFTEMIYIIYFRTINFDLQRNSPFFLKFFSKNLSKKEESLIGLLNFYLLLRIYNRTREIWMENWMIFMR